MGNSEYQKIMKEVKAVNNTIIKHIKTNRKSNIEQYYRGVCILFTPLISNAAILILGENSGSGYYKENNKIRNWYKPLRHNEYVTENYQLAKNVKDIFSDIDKYELLLRSVKTNFYYFISDNLKSLKRLIHRVYEDIGIDIENKSQDWTERMIRIVNPKIILCEGFGAFNYLSSIPCLNMSITKDLEYVKQGVYNGIQIIGFKRIYSNIFEKKKFTEDFLALIENAGIA